MLIVQVFRDLPKALTENASARVAQPKARWRLEAHQLQGLEMLTGGAACPLFGNLAAEAGKSDLSYSFKDETGNICKHI